MMKRQEKIAKTIKEKGITLIALVITIVVLLILAGVSIATLTGDNGILTQATNAKETTQQAEEKEESDLSNLDDYMSNYFGGVNKPRLAEGMTPVYWAKDSSGELSATPANNTTEIEKGKTGVTFKEENWYEYVAGDNVDDSRKSRWANAKTSDGSYWVWIPRFEYKILKNEGKKSTGQIEVKFIPTTQTTPDTDYKIHPAFRNGNGNYANGEWKKELAGIWVAKFEMSAEGSNGKNIPTPATNATTLSDSLRLVSKPGYQSWRNMDESSCYKVCYNYDRAKESHLMKNSEWGAVAYLTHSQYGRNGKEITINNSNEYKTGSSKTDTGTENDYTKAQGASSTGNVYGIYDLSGGAWEYVAAYITNNNAKNNGTYFTCVDGDKKKELIKTSTPYATVYPCNLDNDTNQGNYDAYKAVANSIDGNEINVNRYGDAILETSEYGSGNNSWNGDYSNFPYAGNPFFLRGGSYYGGGDAGVFYFSISNGGASPNYSFRACLCV